jgi:hypothetical protein
MVLALGLPQETDRLTPHSGQHAVVKSSLCKSIDFVRRDASNIIECRCVEAATLPSHPMHGRDGGRSSSVMGPSGFHFDHPVTGALGRQCRCGVHGGSTFTAAPTCRLPHRRSSHTSGATQLDECAFTRCKHWRAELPAGAMRANLIGYPSPLSLSVVQHICSPRRSPRRSPGPTHYVHGGACLMLHIAGCLSYPTERYTPCVPFPHGGTLLHPTGNCPQANSTRNTHPTQHYLIPSMCT